MSAERARQADPVGLREALEAISDLYHNDNLRPGTVAIRAGEIADAALASLPAQAVEPGPLVDHMKRVIPSRTAGDQ